MFLNHSFLEARARCKRFHVQQLECSHEEADTRISYMLSMLPKQGTTQSLFTLPTLMWQSLPVDWLARY